MLSLSVFKKLLRTSFGVVFSQILNLLLIPVLSRIYTPDEFGPWAIYYAFITVLGAVATLRFSDAIVLVEGRHTIKRLIGVCIWSGLIVSSLSAVLVVGYFAISQDVSPALFWLPLSVLCYSFYLTGMQLLVKNERFFTYSLTVLCVSALPSVFQILMGLLFGPVASNLILGAVIGHLITATVSFIFSYSYFKEAEFFHWSVLSQAKVFKRYPVYSGGFAICSMIRTRAIYFLLGQTGNTVELSKYAQSDRILNSPGTVLAAIIRPVFFREISRGSIQEVAPNLLWLLRLQWMVLGPLCGWLFFHMVFLSETVLGPKWYGVGFSAQCLLFPAFLNMTSNWLDRGYDILKIQKSNFKIEFYFGIIILCLLAISVYGIKNIHVTFVLSGIALCMFYLTWIYCLFNKLGFSIFKLMGLTLISFLPLGITLLSMKAVEAFVPISKFGLLGLTFIIAGLFSLLSLGLLYKEYQKRFSTRSSLK